MKTQPMSRAQQEIVAVVPCNWCGAEYNEMCRYPWPRRLFGGRPRSVCQGRIGAYIDVSLQRIFSKERGR